MRSIRPGRGASELGRTGAIFAALFGILWTGIAIAIAFTFITEAGGIFAIVGAIFPLFGILFIILALKQAKFHQHNATSPEPHSLVDIVDAKEEGDPFAKYDRGGTAANSATTRFCPKCGAGFPDDSSYCPKCGAKVR